MYFLEEMWLGNINPCDRVIRKGSRYAEVVSLSHEHLEKFRSELSAEGKKAYEEYFTAQMELADISERDSFIRGIRIGARFILDVVGEYHSQLPQPHEEHTAG